MISLHVTKKQVITFLNAKEGYLYDNIHVRQCVYQHAFQLLQEDQSVMVLVLGFVMQPAPLFMFQSDCIAFTKWQKR